MSSTLPVVLILAFLAGVVEPLAAQNRVITFSTGQAVMLRWIDLNDGEAEGYIVYRSISNGEWERLTDFPIRRVMSEKEIEEIAGYKTDLYLGLFGAERARDLTEADYQRTLSGEGADFIRLMLLTNPGFGILMGQVYDDTGVAPGLDVRYRIAALVNGAEREVATTRSIRTGVKEDVPPVEGVEGVEGDRSAIILWQRDQQTLDTGSVVGYNVYRSLSPIGPFEQVNSLEISPISVSFQQGEKNEEKGGEYLDKWLDNGTPYYYHVRSVNLFGIESRPSTTVEVIPVDRQVPLPPSSLRVEDVGDHLVVSWETGSDDVAGMELYRAEGSDGAYHRVFSTATGVPDEVDSIQTWIDTDVTEGLEYFYFGRVISETGVKSLSSDTISFFVEDHTPPAPPAQVEGRGEKDGILIRWQPNGEKDLLGYEIERAGDTEFRRFALMTDRPLETTSWKDEVSKVSETSYGYVVYAVDQSYNRSAPSRIVYARMPDIVPPQRPIITRLQVEEEKVVMAWTPSPQSDLAGYVIYRSQDEGEFIAVGKEGRATFTEAPSSDGAYRYSVSAVDSAGNESERSASSVIQYARDQRLASPSFVRAEKKEGYILVSWADVEGAAGYVLYRLDPETRRSFLLAEPEEGEKAFKDWHSDQTKEQLYVVQARDSEWRLSKEAEGRFLPEN